MWERFGPFRSMAFAFGVGLPTFLSLIRLVFSHFRSPPMLSRTTTQLWPVKEKEFSRLDSVLLPGIFIWFVSVVNLITYHFLGDELFVECLQFGVKFYHSGVYAGRGMVYHFLGDLGFSLRSWLDSTQNNLFWRWLIQMVRRVCFHLMHLARFLAKCTYPVGTIMCMQS